MRKLIIISSILGVLLIALVSATYTAPSYTNVTIVLKSSYTAPTYTNVTIVLDQVTSSNCWTKTTSVLFIPTGCVYNIASGSVG